MPLETVKQNPEASRDDLRRMSNTVNELVKNRNGDGFAALGISPISTASFSVSDLYSTYPIDATDGDVTITVPSIDSLPGRVVDVTKIDNSSNSYIWNAPVNGSTCAIVTAQYTTLTFYAAAGSSEWRIK